MNNTRKVKWTGHVTNVRDEVQFSWRLTVSPTGETVWETLI